MRKTRFKMRKSKNKIIRFIQVLIDKVADNDVTGMAAQLAYFFLLSLFPLLIFIITLLPYTPLSSEDIFQAIKDFAPTESLELVESTITDIMGNRSGGLLSIGVIGTLWSASKGMNALSKSLNRAYEVQEERSFIISRSLSVMFTLAMIFVFILALMLPVFGRQLGVFIFSSFGLSEAFLQVWAFLRWAISLCVLFIVFLGIYYFAPSIRFRCITAFPGAIFASVGWMIVSFGFSFYVSNFTNYESTYGNIGGIIILMLWFYVSSIIIIVGGEINSMFIEKKKGCIDE